MWMSLPPPCYRCNEVTCLRSHSRSVAELGLEAILIAKCVLLSLMPHLAPFSPLPHYQRLEGGKLMCVDPFSKNCSFGHKLCGCQAPSLGIFSIVCSANQLGLDSSARTVITKPQNRELQRQKLICSQHLEAGSPRSKGWQRCFLPRSLSLGCRWLPSLGFFMCCSLCMYLS